MRLNHVALTVGDLPRPAMQVDESTDLSGSRQLHQQNALGWAGCRLALVWCDKPRSVVRLQRATLIKDHQRVFHDEA